MILTTAASYLAVFHGMEADSVYLRILRLRLQSTRLHSFSIIVSSCEEAVSGSFGFSTFKGILATESYPKNENKARTISSTVVITRVSHGADRNCVPKLDFWSKNSLDCWWEMHTGLGKVFGQFEQIVLS